MKKCLEHNAQEYKNLYLNDKFSTMNMSTDEILNTFRNSKNLKNKNLLLKASGSGDSDLIVFFIISGVDINQYFYENIYEHTCLTKAIMNKQIETVKTLIENGIDINKILQQVIYIMMKNKNALRIVILIKKHL